MCETRELMAAGGGYCCGPPQINQCMRNTGDCLWECRRFLSTQNEQYETRRARGDFPLVNRSRMVSLSRADKKKSVRDNSNKKQKCVPKYTLAAINIPGCMGNTVCIYIYIY